jgi:SAM-dependent methyltransferase
MFFYDSPLAPLLYDLQHEGDPVLEAEREMLLEEIARADGPVLDLGCGTGRILIPALERGADIAGCDGSAAFLQRLREKGSERGVQPRVWQGDLRMLGVDDEQYALAFAAFRTFEHLWEENAQEAMLREAWRALVPGGRLLVNVANPDPMDLEAAVGQKVLLRDDLTDPRSGRRIVWWGASRIDGETGILQESSVYDFLEADGRIAESYYFDFRMRWIPYEEMVNLAESAGFEVANCWGGFTQEPYEVGTGDSVWELRKACGAPARFSDPNEKRQRGSQPCILTWRNRR